MSLAVGDLFTYRMNRGQDNEKLLVGVVTSLTESGNVCRVRMAMDGDMFFWGYYMEEKDLTKIGKLSDFDERI